MRVTPGLLVLSLFLTARTTAQPIASRITVGTPDANYQTTVIGTAGAVEANADIILVTLDTGHFTITRATTDGGFSTALFAPRGTSILIKSDPTQTRIRSILNSPAPAKSLSEIVSLHGTVLTIPMSAAETGFPFSCAGVLDGLSNLAPWIVEGTISRQAAAPGESIDVRGVYNAITPESGATNPRVNFAWSLELMSDAAGRPHTAYAMLDSAVATPTGLLIERFPNSGLNPGGGASLVFQGGKWSAPFAFTVTIPPDFSPGFYLLRLTVNASGLPVAPIDPAVGRTSVSQFRNMQGKARASVLRIGTPLPPRIPATLLLGDLVEGKIGAIALEDRDSYAPANHIATASDVAIVPRTDSRTGALRHYTLDPFTTAIGLSDRGSPITFPLIPLRFPSGSVTATLRSPSGTTRAMGPSPFRQWHLFGPADAHGQNMEGGPHITDPFQLQTLDPAFDITFAEDGLHVVTMDGQIDDIWGNRWRIAGTYEIVVARSLLIDSAVIPTTPFEMSDAIAVSVQIVPPVPADVELRIRHAVRSAVPAIDKRINGKANRFGVFSPSTTLRFTDPSEYRIDVTANYRDATGALWSGSRTWGAVVAPRESSIIAHGRRGIDNQPGEKQQWYFRSQTGDPPGDDHIQFPFHSGDVAWLQEGDSAIPIITVDDRQGAFVAALQKIPRPQFLAGTIADRATKGEVPLISGNSNGRDPDLAPDRAEIWAYSYRGVERPMVRVRETIGEDFAEAYWRFNDRYALQSGNGANGDLPNDFKFQFGGAVVRGTLFNPPLYAIYGSLFVLVPENDTRGGSRVFPPFQGNGGGPSGGPLFTLKGRDIDLFFHPTAVRPGSILQIAEIASFAGYSAPTLPSKIDIVVTAPSGTQRTIRGQANKIGYFYDPGQDFPVFETGVWKAKVKITFDGQLGFGGQVTAPFPTGDVLGSREGEFYFYVVDGQSSPLEVAPMPQFVRPADAPITFRVTPPAGLTNVEMTYTTMMPGFILEEGKTSALFYTYDAQRLARDFPNLDLTDSEGHAGADIITISFLLSGTDSSGVRRHFARQIVINGEELLMPEQKPGPARRRSVRR